MRWRSAADGSAGSRAKYRLPADAHKTLGDVTIDALREKSAFVRSGLQIDDASDLVWRSCESEPVAVGRHDVGGVVVADVLIDVGRAIHGIAKIGNPRSLVEQTALIHQRSD